MEFLFNNNALFNSNDFLFNNKCKDLLIRNVKFVHFLVENLKLKMISLPSPKIQIRN